MNNNAILNALGYLADNEISIPNDLKLKLEAKGILQPFKRSSKQADSVEEANAQYHDTITQSLTDYFEEGGNMSSYKNEFKRGVLNAFYDVYDIGWQEGGGELPIDDEDAKSWIEARVSEELGYIDGLFQEAKELRKEKDFEYFDWITARADGYTRMLIEIFNQAKLRALEDIMVTFDGDDGEESCRSCQNLKGKRHKISWFVTRNYVPPYGIGLDCGRGGHCLHGLYDDQGNLVTYDG